MPLYEYRCATCEKRVEALVRSSATVPVCPDCGRPLTERLFSAPHVLRGESLLPAGHTCCGREERCGAPPCSDGGACRRD